MKKQTTPSTDSATLTCAPSVSSPISVVLGILLVFAIAGCSEQIALMSLGSNPVCNAIKADNLDLAMQLVRDGADPNAGYGCALTASASRGQLEMVRLLLDRGASPNREIKGDLSVILGASSPLHSAVISRDLKVVRLLLERGADPRRDIDAFSVAINFYDVELAELLLGHGADPNMTYPDTDIVYAFVDKEMIAVPRADLAPNRIDETAKRLRCRISFSEGASLLHLAISPGGPDPADNRPKLVKLLLDHGANPNARNLNGTTPLMDASKHLRSAVDMLIASGADVEAKDRCGRTANDY